MTAPFDALPVIVPFFGVGLLLSWSVTCCMVRRTRRVVDNLESRIASLESRAVASAPTQTVYTLPYATQPAYPPSTGIGVYYPPRPTAPPSAMSF